MTLRLAPLAALACAYAVSCSSDDDMQPIQNETGGAFASDPGSSGSGGQTEASGGTLNGGGSAAGGLTHTAGAGATPTSGGSPAGGAVGVLGDGIEGVPCGSDRCSSTQTCCSGSCVDGVGTLDSTPCEASDVSVACDGPEDCQSGICCTSEAGLTDEFALCTDKCTQDHATRLCHEHADCQEETICVASTVGELTYCATVGCSVGSDDCPAGTHCETITHPQFDPADICVPD